MRGKKELYRILVFMKLPAQKIEKKINNYCID